MHIYQIRFDSERREMKFCPDDRFVLPGDVQGILDAHEAARVIHIAEIDVAPSPTFIADAPVWYPFSQFERKAAQVVGYPKDDPQGYPKTKTTVLVAGEPRNLEWRIVRRHDSYTGFNGIRNHFAWALQWSGKSPD